MKKYLILILIVLIIGTLVTGVQAAGGKVTKLTGKDAVAMITAVDMFGDPYDQWWQISEAKGKVNMIQPNGNVDVILGVSADGLAPNSLYTVYFDTDGVTQGDYDNTAGPWVLMGEFWTDAYGHGDWNYTAPAGTYEDGAYKISVYINRTDVNNSILISYNIEFNIVPE